jgi:hypothetical protein
MKVFEKRILGRTCGLRRDEMVRGWRKLYNEELHNLYSSPAISRVIQSRTIT